MYEELDRIRQDEYVKQVSQLIDASVNSNNPRLAEALERYRKTFRLPLAEAERMNQTSFFDDGRERENSKREKLATEVQRHYTLATRYIENQDFRGVLSELHKASRLYIDDQDLTKAIDNLFEELSAANMVFPANPTVEEIAALTQKLPENEGIVLRTWLEHQIPTPEESTDITPIQPRVRATGSYRLVMEEASPEFLLDQVHSDIQYPHEVEAFRIFRQIQIS